MADTASLIARVKTEGVAAAAKDLDSFQESASAAEQASDKLTPAVVKVDKAIVNAGKGAKDSAVKIVELGTSEKGATTATDNLTIAIDKTTKKTEDLGSKAKTTSTALDGLVTTSGKASTGVSALTDTTQKAANDGFAKFRNAAGQVGFQVQDMVVQLQSGTSEFVAIGQQGSQLAGAFGPGGAVLGAVIALASAVGGVLYKSLGNARASAEELKSAQDALQKVLDKTSSGAYEASDALAQLVLSGGSVAEQQALIASASQGLQTQMKDVTLAVKDATEATSSWMYGNAIGANSALNLGQSTSALSGFIENLSDKFGITSDEATKLTPLLAAVQKNSTPENVKALADATANLVAEHGDQNSALVLLNGTLQNYITLTRNSEAASKALKVAQENATKRINEQNDAIIQSVKISNLADKERYKAQAEADKEAFAKRVGVTKEQIAEYNAARDEEARKDIKRVEETEAKRNAAQDKSLMAAQKRIENEAARQQKAADDFLKQVDRTTGDEIARINAAEQQKLDKLAAFHEQGTISAQQYEQAKTDIELTADEARQAELDKRKEDRRKKEEKGEDFMNQILAQNATELELLDIQQKAKDEMAQSYYDRSFINEDEYQQAIAAIQNTYDKKRVSSYSDMLGETTDNLKSALGEGNKMYKAFAIANAVMNTYQAANAAYQSASAIPVVGWVLGPIAAAAAVAAGLANVSKIRSAREQGGNLSVGQVSTIAERNKPEVIMPASASRVRTAEQMRQIMGENSSGNGVTGVTIVNNTSSQISSARTEQDDEGRLRVIISEQVSMELQDSNSPISRSRRATRNQPGFA